MGGTTVYVDLVSGNGTQAFIFEYTILGGDVDADGIHVTSVLPNGDLTFSNGDVDLTLPTTLNTDLVFVSTTPAVEILFPLDLSVINIANNTITYAVNGTCNQTGGDEFHGYIAEFLIFDRELTASELPSLENYLKNKWGTP